MIHWSFVLIIIAISSSIGYRIGCRITIKKYQHIFPKSDLQSIADHTRPVDDNSDTVGIYDMVREVEEEKEIRAAKELGLTEEM